MFHIPKFPYLSIPEPPSNQILLTYFYLSEQFQKIQFELGDPVNTFPKQQNDQKFFTPGDSAQTRDTFLDSLIQGHPTQTVFFETALTDRNM